MAVSGKYMLCVKCKYLIVVLLMFFHRKCLGQQVSFNCETLQPQPVNDFIMGTPDEAAQYTVTVDQQYYQQSSTRRVSVNAGSLAFTSLYLQAWARSGSSVGGWSSPYPTGYSITAGCEANLDTIIKVGAEPAQTAVFEWKPPFVDTSMEIFFVATFVNGGKYYIISSDVIKDPCNPSPCSTNETCFRGTAFPGYFCADACIDVTCQNRGTCTIRNGEAECICTEGLTGNTCERCEANFCQNGGICIINSGEQPQCLCPGAFMGTRCQFVRDGSATACGSNPCLNGGSCGLQSDGGYICTCSNGYYGNRCENSNAFCLNQGCLNGGTCTPIGTSGGSCSCAEGYIGGRCEQADPCFNFCQNGGTCSTVGNGVTCQCPLGFQGTQCENSDQFCSLNWCKNGATCLPFTDGVGGFCMCPSGFSGPYCDETENTFCSQSPCLNGGECLNLTMGAGQCKCTADFTGALCEEPVRQGCFPNNCQNGGSCVSISSTASQCQCADGYTGSHCEEIKDFCSYNLCQNGATCINSEMRCICDAGFTGTACDQPILSDFCEHDLCQNGATCVNTETIGYCICAAGFTGAACDQMDTSGFCSLGFCQNGATCIETSNGGSCVCAEGFTGSTCETLTQGFCSLGFCQNGATCIETSNGGSCVCAEGFTGSTCETVTQDPCSPNPCFNGGNCFTMAEAPSFICVCPLGFTGALCQDVETPCTSNPCENGATCSVIAGSNPGYSCQCVSPFVGTNCETVSPCFANPCLNGGACSVNQGSPPGYSCQCVSPFVGTNCETVSPCVPNPCQNGGACSVNQGSSGYSCQCPNFFLGTNCEIVSPCIPSPCQNGGQCTPSSEGFSCTCQGFWRGERCDMEDYCRSRQPCQNGGTCLFTGHEAYQCQCLPTFTGQNCQFVSPCNPSPCRNRGTCIIVSFTEFQCNCPLQVFGRTCEIQNPCASNPCLSGGTCQPASDGSSYTCNCPPGRTGSSCQFTTGSGDACSNSQCVNGTCVEDAATARNYRCECQEGFDGEFCDNIADMCLALKPCLNGGSCVNQGTSSYSCNCVTPYFGDDCLFNRDNGPVFQDCVDTTHTYQLRPDNTAYINLNITARVPETGQVIGYDIIVGPDSVTFPGVVTYTEDYLEGQKFVLRAMDQFRRETSCSFTIKLSDPIAPTVQCPGDHEDISSRDRVVVSSLPLPLIEASDNIGLPEDDVFSYSPAEVNVDGRLREVTVSVYDIDGNRAECQFGLAIHKGDECSSINTDNGRVNCSMNSDRNRACEIRCNEGFLSPNGDLYTCRNNNWDNVPLPCLAIQEPNSFSKRITIVFSVIPSLCEQDEFLMNVTEAMRAKLTELDLCGQGSSASACGENSISASCKNQGDQNLRRKRQTTESEVEIDVEISGSSQDDVTGLITSIEDEINEGFTVSVDQDVEFVSYNVPPQFTVACQSGSISRQEVCLICPVGTYHHSASNECLQCRKGTFQDEVGQLQCKECTSSNFQDQLGQTSCNPCDVGLTSLDGVTCSPSDQPVEGSWVQIVIYGCVGVGALLVIIIFILMVCLWQSTQEEKKQDQKRWELGYSTQLNKSYEPEEETGFRPRINTTVSATTYQTVPEGDGTPNLGNGVINGGHELVRIPTEELYSGLTVDTHGRTLTVGVESHPAPQPRRYPYENGYHTNHHSPASEFMSYGHDRHNFPVL